MTTVQRKRSWLEFSLAYVDMKWPSAAPKTRDAMIDALASVIPALVGEEPPGAIRCWQPAPCAAALSAGASLPHSGPSANGGSRLALAGKGIPSRERGRHAQACPAVLDTICVLQDGRAASATTIARKRSVFANVLRYAVEKEELPSSPLDRLSWKPPKVPEVVDRRVVVNPRQARQLLVAVTYVGYQRRGPFARGQRLMALYACMYFAALRPAEAVALRQQDCHLPAAGWGRLTLEKSRPEVNRRWSDSASAHAERGLKHRPATETRQVPIPAELVTILRQHIDTFGVALDGRIFSSDRGRPVASTAISDVWAEARTLALMPAQVVSPLGGRPYDLRHAAVSLWLNAGVPATHVAERAGHSVEVLLRVYAKCVDGGDKVANMRIDAALQDSS